MEVMISLSPVSTYSLHSLWVGVTRIRFRKLQYKSRFFFVLFIAYSYLVPKATALLRTAHVFGCSIKTSLNTDCSHQSEWIPSPFFILSAFKWLTCSSLHTSLLLMWSILPNVSDLTNCRNAKRACGVGCRVPGFPEKAPEISAGWERPFCIEVCSLPCAPLWLPL